MALVLHGYDYSVYVWVARLALAQKGVAHDHREVNPFADEVPADYLALNPFGNVPTLVQDDFVLYETGSIIRYVDEVFDGPSLQPTDPRDRARMNQIIAIVDTQAYRPMVRQVFSHLVYGPSIGRAVDAEEGSAGLERSAKVLAALEALMGQGPWLVGDTISLADLHMAPMMAYFCMAPEGAALLRDYPRLQDWWTAMQQVPALRRTDPGLPSGERRYLEGEGT